MNLPDVLRSQIARLELLLSKGDRHECRFCLWFDCGKNDNCKCGCGKIGIERKAHLDSLKTLADCFETGELPQLVDD